MLGRCKQSGPRGGGGWAAALSLVAASHPKGPLLVKAWIKALGIMPHAGLRSRELQRIATLLRDGNGERLGGKSM